MTERRPAARPARAAKPAGTPKKPGAPAASPYGYAWTEWLAREDPEYASARLPLSALSTGEGKELSIKHREMVIIGILAFRGRQDGVVAHMRRAIQHGATKRELLEAIQAAAVPGGGPTLSAGVQALMQLESAGAFKRAPAASPGRTRE
jgi:alkylhydroperoxidase/carboxymuconolactone decarboxylase family protein YurZ